MKTKKKKELDKLSAATVRFEPIMFKRLAEKANKGYKGWEKLSLDALIERIRKSCQRLCFGEHKEIDIANLAMMIYNKRHPGELNR